MQSICRVPSRRSQSFVKQNFRTPLLLAIEQITARNVSRQHFLKTHGLRTQLHSIAVVRFGFATFVFDRRDGPVLEGGDLFAPRSQTWLFVIVVGGRPGLRPRVKQ